MHGKPLCIYTQQAHSSNYYQRPQIKHDIDFMSPLPSNIAADTSNGLDFN